jgi:hypothetical protein
MAEHFDLDSLAKELDSNSRPARFASVAFPGFMILLLTIFVAAFASRIETRTLSYLGWFGLLFVAGVTGLTIVTGRHMLWGSRRAAVAVNLDSEGFEMVYPGGPSTHFYWSDPRLNFKLDDLAEVPASRKVLSTLYIVTERDRVSALSPQAYARIIADARSHASIVRAKVRKNWINPWLYLPCTWTVTAQVSAPINPDMQTNSAT